MRHVLLLVLLAIGHAASAAEITSLEICLARIDEDAAAAFDEAETWHDMGGGADADQCAAQALVALGQTSEAALRFEAIARGPQGGNAAARAALFAQAGNAWLLSGDGSRAVESFTHGLTLKPFDPDTLIDRARAYMLLRQTDDAERDLSSALAKAPRAVDAYILRAAVRRLRGRLDGAVSDAAAALRLDPQNADAFLERGLAHEARGDDRAAHADFRAALRYGGDSPAGREAQERLERAALAPAAKGAP